MSGTCTFEGCTVDETGICALERNPSTCGNRAANDASSASLDEGDHDISEVSSPLGDRLGAAVLDQPTHTRPFPSSRTLGPDELNKMMGARYVSVVGILGDPESGKTACLASLYLLISHAKLEGWSFADSKSLTAFEEIARGARVWNEGSAPEQMTVHTEMADDRRPGFMHLRLVRQSDGRRVDLALPDIPGEWTQELISTARVDRLDFLKSAEAIWVVLDGRSLANLEKRNGLIVRMGQLAARLKSMLEGRKARLIAVVTHHDSHILDDQIAQRLRDEINRRGAEAQIIGVAPFSDRPESVAAGHGLAELVNLTIGARTDRPAFWRSKETAEGDRAYLTYRRTT